MYSINKHVQRVGSMRALTAASMRTETPVTEVGMFVELNLLQMLLA